MWFFSLLVDIKFT